MSRRSHSSQPNKKPQHSQSLKKSNLSQPGPSGRAQKSITDFYNKEADHQSEYINKCVGYILLKAGNNQPIKKSEVQKDVLGGHARLFNKVIEGAIPILKNVYGYNLHLLEGSSVVLYGLNNNLPYLNLVGEEEDVDNRHNVLILLILSHVFMMNNECSDASLTEFLGGLNISFKNKHSIFGDVDDFVHKEMVKEKLLVVNKDANEKIIYSWGPKAECCIPKMKVLKFVAKMYGKPPKTWAQQFKQAEEQLEEQNEEEERENQQSNDDSDSN